MTTLAHAPLGRSGIRVSELCLGTMTFGTAWGWGAEESVCREIYSAYREAGGTFLDTANLYTAGESEEIVGRLVAGERDEVVLGTKFVLPTGSGANAGGGSRKSLRLSVETSLRRLGTDHLDVLWVHAWDQQTPLEETLHALDALVASGKVLALGVSNTPAWVVARADAVAESHGWARLSALQVEYSLVRRTPERELLPMADALGLCSLGNSPLARGWLTGKAKPGSEEVAGAVALVARIAEEAGATPAQVSIAWVAARGLLPVLGARTLAQLQDNLAAASLELSTEHLADLDAATAPSLGYPHDFLNERCPTLAPPRRKGSA